ATPGRLLLTATMRSALPERYHTRYDSCGPLLGARYTVAPLDVPCGFIASSTFCFSSPSETPFGPRLANRHGDGFASRSRQGASLRPGALVAARVALIRPRRGVVLPAVEGRPGTLSRLVRPKPGPRRRQLFGLARPARAEVVVQRLALLRRRLDVADADLADL